MIIEKVYELTEPCNEMGYNMMGHPEYFANEDFISELCNIYAEFYFSEGESFRKKVAYKFIKSHIEHLAKTIIKYKCNIFSGSL
jgi:hypothetical protein